MKWKERIDRAGKERGGFKQEDKRLVRDWDTCACGEQDVRIPRSPVGQPCDPKLSHLGMKFSFYVNNHFVAEARVILAQIEQRASQILAEMTDA